MNLIEVAYPRSGNSYLVHLLKSGLDSLYYFTIPRDFYDENEMDKCLSENVHKNKIVLLGHNHLSKDIEIKLADKHRVLLLFLFRHPLDCISSLFVLRKDKNPNYNIHSIARTIRTSLLYNKIAYYALIYLIKKNQ